LGWGHVCLVAADHSVWCWGEDDFGQIGNGHTIAYPGGVLEPFQVPGITDAAEVALGGRFTCVRKMSGTVVCWGDNSYGQLGIGSGEPAQPMPGIDVEGLPADAIEVAAGFQDACAVLSNGSAYCWGRNQWGQLGDGLVGGFATSPMQVLEAMGTPLDGAIQMAVGSTTACAVLRDTSLRCWGYTNYIGTGDDAPVAHRYANRVAIPSGVSRVASGDAHTCAAYGAANQVACWGDDSVGQIGNNAVLTRPVLTPTDVAGLVGVVDLRASYGSSYAVVDSSAMLDWGQNTLGELGDGGTTNQLAPEVFSSLGGKVSGLAVAFDAACAKDAEGDVWCWGANDAGQLANGTFDSGMVIPHPTPTRVVW
jgi:alpha-tubulin suppressor-like RCC1 family protein